MLLKGGDGTDIMLTASGPLILGVIVAASGLMALLIARMGSYDRLSRHRIGRWLVIPYWPVFRDSPQRGKRALQLAGVFFLIIGVVLLTVSLMH
jgi:hypothetical protein